ncbi:MAG: SDR family oxidoreductase [Sphingomonadaceae bacterium]|nr:SDR family oxidoreductase [Sphingomonadaceae bacterium]
MSEFDFNGAHVVVTGGASGVGAALLDVLDELGKPRVTVLDINQPSGPHSAYIQTNLADPASLDAAAAQIGGPIDALFNNAGVADTSQRDIVLAVNLLAPIRLTEALQPKIRDGGAVAITASVAGMNWPQRFAEIQELLSLDGWDAKSAWLDGRDLGVDTYSFTKEVMQVWTMRDATRLRQNGIRINSVCPAPIETPLLADFRETIGEAGIDFGIQHSGGRPVSPREVATVLAFLASPAASFVSGQNLDIDLGFRASLATGMLDSSAVRASSSGKE